MLKPDTKRVLADSLGELMLTRSYDSITIQDIVTNCGASRGALYRHFRDKQDLLHWAIRTHLVETIERMTPPVTTAGLFKVTAQALLEKRRMLMQVINDSGQNCFLQFFYDDVLEHNIKTVKTALQVDALDKATLNSIRMYTGGVFMVYTDWIRMGFIEPPDEVADILITNMPEGLRPYLVQ